jgi:hypothetical protein
MLKWSQYYPLTPKTRITAMTFFRVSVDGVEPDGVILIGSSRVEDMTGKDILPKIPPEHQSGLLLWISYCRHDLFSEDEIQEVLEELSGEYPEARVLW